MSIILRIHMQFKILVSANDHYFSENFYKKTSVLILIFNEAIKICIFL